MDLVELVLRLGTASILGGLIGLERERHNRPAGLRTHMLVAVGSALLMMISIAVAEQYIGQSASADPGRIAAQVVSGIGFLGAGTILREGLTIRGLTTAASLWVVSALGLASGAGYYVAASVVTVLTLGTLILMSRLEHGWLSKKQLYVVQLAVVDKPGQLGLVASALGSQRINIRHVSLAPQGEGRVEINLTLELPPGLALAQLTERLLKIDGVYGIEVE